MKPSQTARKAIDVLAHRATLKGPRTDPDAYMARVRNDLRARLWDDALAIATDDPTTSPEHLADLLDPGSATKPMFPELARPECETYEPEAWKPLDDDKVAHAKARIDEIRASLRGGEVA